MRRYAFYEEHGKCKIEMQKVKSVKPIKNDEVDWSQMPWGIEKQDAYLQIFFHRELDQEELFDLYAVLIEHGLIEMTREEMDEAIQEDLEKQPMGNWELKSNFKNAFECAIRLGNDISFFDHAFTFQINDEPTNSMKTWLDNKELLNKKIAEKNFDFDPEVYHNEDISFAEFNKNREKNFVAWLIGAMVRNGATEEEIANIVKYSMVVIDTKKKHLNWKQAAIDFKVQEMKEKYMPESKGTREEGGAAE